MSCAGEDVTNNSMVEIIVIVKPIIYSVSQSCKAVTKQRFSCLQPKGAMIRFILDNFKQIQQQISSQIRLRGNLWRLAVGAGGYPPPTGVTLETVVPSMFEKRSDNEKLELAGADFSGPLL